MLSFYTQYTQFQDLAADETAEALVFGKRNINIGQHILETELGSFVTEATRTGSTSSSTNVVNLPENFTRLKAFYVTIGTRKYACTEVFDEDSWQRLDSNTSGNVSDFAQYVFVRRNTLEVIPRPSSTNTWTMIYEATSKDMQYADYTTGTITTLANLGTAVTGSGTTWTSAMIGRYFRIDTDGEWYDITAVGSATTLTLGRAYQGTAIAAGTSTYTIGEMSRTPGPTHHIPTLYALWQYFDSKKDPQFGPKYKRQYEESMKWAKSTYGRRFSTGVIPSQRHLRSYSSQINPNMFPTNIG